MVVARGIPGNNVILLSGLDSGGVLELSAILGHDCRPDDEEKSQPDRRETDGTLRDFSGGVLGSHIDADDQRKCRRDAVVEHSAVPQVLDALHRARVGEIGGLLSGGLRVIRVSGVIGHCCTSGPLEAGCCQRAAFTLPYIKEKSIYGMWVRAMRCSAECKEKEKPLHIWH